MSIKTPVGTVSYPHLVEPQQQTDDDGKPVGKPKYSMTLIFAPNTDLTALQELERETVAADFGQKGLALLKTGGIRSAFRTDAEKKGYEPGSIFINVRTTRKPGVVFAYAGEDGKPKRIPEDLIETELYPGSKARISVNAFTYNTKGNKGVSFSLENVQKMGDGERIDGRRKAEDDFDADPNATPADLSDLGAI